MHLKVLALAFAAILLLGCTRTVIGGYSESPAKTFCVWGKVYGAYGRSFMENTTKTIRISITQSGASERVIFKKEYQLQASNIGWHVTWHGETNVVVSFFEYAAGVNRYDTVKPAPPTNFLRSVTFILDATAGKIVE